MEIFFVPQKMPTSQQIKDEMLRLQADYEAAERREAEEERIRKEEEERRRLEEERRRAEEERKRRELELEKKKRAEEERQRQAEEAEMRRSAAMQQVERGGAVAGPATQKAPSAPAIIQSGEPTNRR